MAERRTILIVEDHTPSRELMRKLFTLRGWRVVTASTVAEGLRALDPPPDCLVLNLVLPDGDGERILREVRARGLPTRVAVCTVIGDAGHGRICPTHACMSIRAVENRRLPVAGVTRS